MCISHEGTMVIHVVRIMVLGLQVFVTQFYHSCSILKGCCLDHFWFGREYVDVGLALMLKTQ